MNEINENEIREWTEKITGLTSGSDLSSAEDLSIGLMNLISLEEHFYFSAMKTGDQKYLEMLGAIREIRKQVMQQLVKQPDGEEWCVSKHLLAASMRLIETGNKKQAQKQMDVAYQLYDAAFQLYALFFGINFKSEKTASQGKQIVRNFAASEKSEKHSFLNTIATIVKKAVDCCRE